MTIHDPFAPWVDQPRRTHPGAQQLHVVALLHKYPPWHNAGAEWMAHGLLRDMVRRGHTVTVLVNQPLGAATTFQGVQVERYRHPGQMVKAGAHVAVTHLDLTRYAVSAAGSGGLPLVHLLHNDRQLEFHRVRPKDAALCVANSYWIREKYRWWPGPMEVVHPPVEPQEYAVGDEERTGERLVTLLNLSDAKGGPLFWHLAELMPHRQFLAVMGAYAHQALPDTVPANVTLIANTPRVVRDVYARTAVLLMPSSYESWGRCAVEAACSGIPTVAHPTEGLVESMASTGVWCDRDDPAQWVAAIDRLYDDENHYGDVSERVRKRALELDPGLPGGDYDRFEKLMLMVARGTLQDLVAEG